MTIRQLALAVLLGSICVAPLGAQQFHQLPVGSWANDVTPDGSIVVGTWQFGNGFIWNLQQDPAPTVVLGGDIVGVSDDGTVVCGNFFDSGVGATVAGRWTEATGWQSLGWLPNAPCGSSYATAYDISGDGTTIVGLSWNSCSARGFRWTEATGMQELMNLVNGNNRASAISDDGSAIGGFAQGSFSRTPAFWDASTAGEVISPDDLGEVFGFNNDGSKSLGTYFFGGSTYDAFLRDRATGAMTNLGSLNNGWSGNATDMNESGSIIVGYDVNGLSREAWVWTPTGGIISLNDRLDSLGIEGASALFVCRACSDDGGVIVGGGIGGGGGPFGFAGFVVTLADGTWQDLGGGTAGINGVPELKGKGLLVGGSTATLTLTKASSSMPVLAWLSFSSTPLNVIGGTLHANPFTSQFLFSTNPDGVFEAATTWPVGVPPGTEAWFQFIVQDPSVIYGLTLSNGLKATTP